MKRTVSDVRVRAAGAAVAALAVACEPQGAERGAHREPPRLRSGAAAVCVPARPLVLDRPAGSGYRLNSEPQDSAAIERWLRLVAT